MQLSVSYVSRWLVLALLVCLFVAAPVAAEADERVGRVMIAMGGVTAEREGVSMRGLGRRDAIHAGDRIRTGPRGRAQIRFQDGGMIDLDPSSTFQVEEYTSEDDDEDGGGSAVMSFLAGAMRTITGAIGANRGDDYRMTTTVATIGVRGTAYALEYCDAACAEDGGSEGLYGRVDDGEVEVDGPGGIGGFSKGQYFFVPDDGAPERIVAPPDGILEGDGETGAGGDDDRIEDVSIKPLDTGEEDGAGLDREDSDLLDPDRESADEFDGAEDSPEFTAAFAGADSGFDFSLAQGKLIADSDTVGVDADGQPISAVFDDPFGGSAEISVGTASLVESGQVESLDVSFGRWEGQFNSPASRPPSPAIWHSLARRTSPTPTESRS